MLKDEIKLSVYHSYSKGHKLSVITNSTLINIEGPQSLRKRKQWDRTYYGTHCVVLLNCSSASRESPFSKLNLKYKNHLKIRKILVGLKVRNGEDQRRGFLELGKRYTVNW